MTGIAEDPHTFFMGVTGGGVWKTDDAGHHWTPIADDYLTTGNIGAIDVADSDPNVDLRGHRLRLHPGERLRGPGRLEDPWTAGTVGPSSGLPESGAIGSSGRSPQDPDLVYVAALGHPFGKNPERGVYRSQDGGATWENVLFLNDSTGAVSLAMDPSNPRIIYAGMWRAERKPWTLISGGPEGGLYKSTDGGDSWDEAGRRASGGDRREGHGDRLPGEPGSGLGPWWKPNRETDSTGPMTPARAGPSYHGGSNLTGGPSTTTTCTPIPGTKTRSTS